MTRPTSSVAMFVKSGVLRREFVPMLAVGFCSLVGNTSSNRFAPTVPSGIASFCSHLRKRHAGFGSLDDGVTLKAVTLGQIYSQILVSIYHKLTSSSLISLLFLACSPSAIRRLVVSVVIPAIKRSAIRPWPHVGFELLEAVPSLADVYTATSVVRELSAGSRKASTPHALPHRIDWIRVFERHQFFSAKNRRRNR